MKLNWSFLREGRVQNKKPSVRGVWIFSGTEHCDFALNFFTIDCKKPNLF